MKSITISEQLAKDLLDSMEWMIQDLNWRREQTELPSAMSPEMITAIASFETLKKVYSEA